MVVASYVFYAWWDWRFIFLLAASTAIAYVGGRLVDPATGRRRVVDALGHPRAAARPARVVQVLRVRGRQPRQPDPLPRARPSAAALDVTLPVGISFFTFMAISYVVDIYRGVLRPARGIDVTVYLSFFPHLIAGPIVRGTELLPQIRAMRDPTDVHYVEAFWLIAAGLAKKVVLSSYLSTYVVDPVFADPHQHSALEVLFAIWGYAVQIYADFSGYTDIAIGLALLMGFRFPVNFRRPYTAIDLQDFWRRWHITLSFWLRDYLYIPLGGNRGSEWRVSFNILVTMLLGGLWHGASWTFVLWGAYHGVGQIIGRRRRAVRVARGLPAEPVGPRRSGLGPVRDLPGGLPRVALLPGRHPRQRLRHARPAGGRVGAPSPLVTPLAALAIAVRHRQPVPARRLAAPGPAGLRRPPPGGPGRHTWPGAPGHHHARPPGRGPVHLLPVLTVPPHPRRHRPTPPTEHPGIAYDWSEDDPTPTGPPGDAVAGRRRGGPRRRPDSPATTPSGSACRSAGVPWTRVLIVGVVCFGLWFLLDAPSLQHSAQVSPLGTRRTVSLDVVGPVAALSRTLGLSSVVGWTDRALGRTPGGGPLARRAHRGPPGPHPPAGSTGPTGPRPRPPPPCPVLNLHPTPADAAQGPHRRGLGRPRPRPAAGQHARRLRRRDHLPRRPDRHRTDPARLLQLAGRAPGRPDQPAAEPGGGHDRGQRPPGPGDARRQPPFGQPGWDAAYSARVAAFIAEANAAGAHVLWVGMPPMQTRGSTPRCRHLNSLVQGQVASPTGRGRLPLVGPASR